MANLLIRGIDDELVDHLKKQARERQYSINATVLELLREALGLKNPDTHSEVLHDICMLSGTWSEEETRAFRDAVTELEQVLTDLDSVPGRQPAAKRKSYPAS